MQTLKPRIIFIGCTRHAYKMVNILAESNPQYEITGIITLTNEAAASKSTFVPMEPLSIKYGIPLIKTEDVNNPETVSKIHDLNPDLILQMGWSQIIKAEILSIPRIGVVGVHASYLPQDRGGATANWMLITNRTSGGVTLYFMDEAIDKGPIIAQDLFPIEARDDINTINDKIDVVASRLLLGSLPKILSGNIQTVSQDDSKSSYLPRRKPSDGRIDWDKPAIEILNLIRALTHPFPGAFTVLNGEKLFAWKARLEAKTGPGKPGTVLKIIGGQGVLVKTGVGTILLRRVGLTNGLEFWADEYAGFVLNDCFE